MWLYVSSNEKYCGKLHKNLFESSIYFGFNIISDFWNLPYQIFIKIDHMEKAYNGYKDTICRHSLRFM